MSSTWCTLKCRCYNLPHVCSRAVRTWPAPFVVGDSERRTKPGLCFVCFLCCVCSILFPCFWLSLPVQSIAFERFVSEMTCYMLSHKSYSLTLTLLRWDTFKHLSGNLKASFYCVCFADYVLSGQVFWHINNVPSFLTSESLTRVKCWRVYQGTVEVVHTGIHISTGE